MLRALRAKRARDVPLFVAALPIFSQAYYASGRSTNRRSTSRSGPGPTRSAASKPGRFIEYERVADWWGADLPVCARPEQFRRRALRIFTATATSAFEAFTAKNYLFREEFTSRIWATRYDFPAIKDGRVKRDVLPDDTPSGAQGWFINTRRDKFQDPRVREALIYAFDFEWTNKNIMYGSYERTPFGVPELRHDGGGQAQRRGARAARAVPRQGARRGVRRAVRAAGVRRLGPGPRPAAQGRPRCCKRPAMSSRTASACCPKGELFAIEFLIDEPAFQPHHMPLIKNLGVLGIEATLAHRRSVQYQRAARRLRFRHHSRALQLLGRRRAMRCAPSFARRPPPCKGSHNLAGIADPAIDALIEHIIAADSRADLVTACRALDRVYSRRPLLDSALVQGRRTGSPIGTFSAGPRQNRATLAACRKPGGTTPTRRQDSSSRPGSDRAIRRAPMAAYIIRRLLFMIPTLFGIMLVSFVVVQFAPGGPVERVIAQLQRRRHRRDARAFPASVGRRFRRARRPGRRRRSTPSARNTAARRASIRNSSRSWKSSSASTSRPTSASS